MKINSRGFYLSMSVLCLFGVYILSGAGINEEASEACVSVDYDECIDTPPKNHKVKQPVLKAKPRPHKKMTAEQYIKRFADIAQIEQAKYGIPASIKLAQGILESGAGNSRLCKKSNNHFGIKCGGSWDGPSSAHKDDDYKGGKLVASCFRSYKNAWHSFRDHSKFLQKDNYRHCFECKDYTCWAKGLKRAGYATSKNYHNKLIRIIETHKLYKYDI